MIDTSATAAAVKSLALDDTLEKLQQVQERKLAAMSALMQRVEDREDRVDQKIQYWLNQVKQWQTLPK